MTNMTLSIPESLHKRMLTRTEMRWSDIARQAFEKKLTETELMEEVLRNSKLTTQDAMEIGNKLKREIRKRFN